MIKPGQKISIMGDGICKILEQEKTGFWRVRWLLCKHCPDSPGHESTISEDFFTSNDLNILTESEYLAYKIIES